VSLTHWLHFTPRNTLFTGWVNSRAMVRLEWLGKLKIFRGLNGTPTCNLLDCSIASQPFVLPHATKSICIIFNGSDNFSFHWRKLSSVTASCSRPLTGNRYIICLSSYASSSFLTMKLLINCPTLSVYIVHMWYLLFLRAAESDFMSCAIMTFRLLHQICVI
jgi:hypothetical protein